MASSWLLFPQDFVASGSIEAKERWFKDAALVQLLSRITSLTERLVRTPELHGTLLTIVQSCGREKLLAERTFIK